MGRGHRISKVGEREKTIINNNLQVFELQPFTFLVVFFILFNFFFFFKFNA